MEVNATAGENVTLEFDIVYERGGCRNQDIQLYLFKPGVTMGGSNLSLNNSVYYHSNKTRRVRIALGLVSHGSQGSYEVSMEPYSGDVYGDRSYLAITLNVNGKTVH